MLKCNLYNLHFYFRDRKALRSCNKLILRHWCIRLIRHSRQNFFF